jgi:restriction endonuclease Mrr
VLTDAAIAKAIDAMRDYVDGQTAIRDERLNGIDAATKLRLLALDSIPDRINEEVGHLAHLTDERFAAAERQRVEQKKDTKDAVDAALTAQKEAVREQTAASERAIAKSETATNKLLEQLSATFGTSNEALRRAIDEVKERLGEEARTLRAAITDVASTSNGIVQQKVGAKDDRTAIYAVIAVLASITMVTVGVLAFVIARIQTP